MRIEDVDFERGRLFIRARKGGDEDSPRIMPSFMGWIREYLDQRDDDCDALFIAPYTGTPITAEGVQAIYTKQVSKYFGQHVTSHMMRHTMVAGMRDNGASDDYIMAQGGWRDRKTFKKYYDTLNLDQIDEAYFFFGVFFGG